jgi:hypothetical protein
MLGVSEMFRFAANRAGGRRREGPPGAPALLEGCVWRCPRAVAVAEVFWVRLNRSTSGRHGARFTGL